MDNKTKMIDNVCCYCQRNHTKQQLCACLCNHCKALHMICDLVEGQCPRKSAFSEKEYSAYVQCSYCKGIKQTQKIESKVSSAQQVNLDFIEFEVENQCSKCNNMRALPLLVNCSTQECLGIIGCLDCGFLKRIPNPNVKKEHMLPTIKHMDQQQCAICLQNVKNGEQSLKMQCGHQFHYLCIAQHLIQHKRCPCCRQTDMFLDVDSEFIKNYQQKAGYSPAHIQLHINGQGDLVEGYQSQSEQNDEQSYTVYVEDDSKEYELQTQYIHQQILSFNQQQVIDEPQPTQLMIQIGRRLIKNGISLTLPGVHQIENIEHEQQEDFTFVTNGYDDYDGLFRW